MTTTKIASINHKGLVALGLSLAFVASAQAQQLGIGTSGQGSATYGIGAAIANVISSETPEDFTVQPYGGTGRVVPLVDTGRTDFGLANILEVTNAVEGRGPFDGRPHENLRIVGVVYPFEVGFFVREDSDIQHINDIEGLRISSEYSGQRIIGSLTEALLANADLTLDDMQGVPTSGIISNADDFAAGQTDVGFFALGAGKVNEVDASVGGLRYIPINDSPEAEARMQEVMPQTYISSVDPREDLTGVHETMPLMAYDYILYTGAHVPDEVIYNLVGSMIEHREALASNYAPLSGLDPEMMGKDVGMPHHPGAIQYYQDNGLWHE
ncbi:TAXI family TRAP transporter solute-binding subunit [Natronospirillum operosum]|uniref:TAXI family TRAP transporter solute-binding subunit n=1 Tax=Natronospirillum operosum TaxID=2759953 RepID=A0A4Z0WDC8_9GAMM|nr:TAXI family TRAP transporter solute-binding subunit [Natronospirillum operosum]TGG95050.1 TAXI family TRAP transporter solute-binding subunit [Natronospirillum operosum]